MADQINLRLRSFPYHKNRLFREGDRPVKIRADRTQEWWQNDLLHREGDAPAVILADGSQAWWRNGKRHRDKDRPAVILADGTQKWYFEGRLYHPLIDLDPHCFLFNQ